MLTIPPAILDLLHLTPGAPVDLAVDGQRLVLQPRRRPHYTLDQLLAECKPRSARSAREDKTWLDIPPVGREL